MGDTGRVFAGRRTRVPPTPGPGADPMPRLALYALVVCLLSVVAAVLSFTRGSGWLGVVWVLLAGLSSNMAWYYRRRAKAAQGAS
ncbi:hypothetical protein ACFT9I_03240 [Streptomyces sp. NPDC057137]|uniref:hypothetical protein n=1 Tax=Streptomyces sp. NPDC057137 TaxID=3346030 RepID=UPI0036291E7E